MKIRPEEIQAALKSTFQDFPIDPIQYLTGEGYVFDGDTVRFIQRGKEKYPGYWSEVRARAYWLLDLATQTGNDTKPLLHKDMYFYSLCSMYYELFPIDQIIDENPIEEVKNGRSFLVNDIVTDGLPCFETQFMRSSSSIENTDQEARRIIKIMGTEMLYEAIFGQEVGDNVLSQTIEEQALRFVRLRREIEQTCKYGSQMTLLPTLDRLETCLTEGGISAFLVNLIEDPYLETSFYLSKSNF